MKLLTPFILSVTVLLSFNSSVLAGESHQVTTSANGEIMAVPDIAVVSGRVTVEAKKAKDATREAQKRLEKVIQFVRQQGVENDDLNAATVQVHPKWHYPRNKPREIVGYQAQAMFSVTLRDIDQLGSLYAGLPEAGASTLDQTRYEFSNREELELQAIAVATKKAKARAQAAVSALQENLGDVINLQVNTNWHQAPMMRMERTMAMSSDASSAPELNVGKHKINASITATFAID